MCNLNYLLFIGFINLYNTISFVHFPSYYILKSYLNKLNMGCDYYIDKNLYLYDHYDKILSFINLEHNRGYYYFDSLLDEDEDDYNKEYKEYLKNILEPTMKPIIIYSNNSFNKLSFENKYKKMVERELNYLKKSFKDIGKIIKEEKRYER